jgi:hypothetical protein
MGRGGGMGLTGRDDSKTKDLHSEAYDIEIRN